MTTIRAAVGPGDLWNIEAGIPYEEVGLLTRVVRLNMVVTHVLDDLAGAHDITVADYLVLASVRRGRNSPAELCAVLGRTTGGMSLALERLVTAGLVARRPDGRDRRRIIVELTDAGRSKAAAVNAALHQWESELELDRDERSEIEANLDRIVTTVLVREG